MLATERLRPKTSPAPRLQPHSVQRPMPSSVARMIWPMAPGMAMPRTAIRSDGGKMQADAEHQEDDADFGQLAARAVSAVKPGVNGPIRMPATR